MVFKHSEDYKDNINQLHVSIGLQLQMNMHLKKISTASQLIHSYNREQITEKHLYIYSMFLYMHACLING